MFGFLWPEITQAGYSRRFRLECEAVNEDLIHLAFTKRAIPMLRACCTQGCIVKVHPATKPHVWSRRNERIKERSTPKDVSSKGRR